MELTALVLLGSTAVGKSSLAFRYVKNDFKETLPTVGCSFFTQLVCLDTATIKFEIWDTAGQEKYHSVCHLYYRGANAALLVFDIARKETFDRAKAWLRELEKEFLHDEILIVLVGNKTDLSAEREVTLEVSSILSPRLRDQCLLDHLLQKNVTRALNRVSTARRNGQDRCPDFPMAGQVPHGAAVALFDCCNYAVYTQNIFQQAFQCLWTYLASTL
uniref:RAB17, member RAS onco family n=1 Tax=Sphenodon punctatus TaxID=8508 RepID=A0A8D0LA69_SPHPU